MDLKEEEEPELENTKLPEREVKSTMADTVAEEGEEEMTKIPVDAVTEVEDKAEVIYLHFLNPSTPFFSPNLNQPD